LNLLQTQIELSSRKNIERRAKERWSLSQ